MTGRKAWPRLALMMSLIALTACARPLRGGAATVDPTATATEAREETTQEAEAFSVRNARYLTLLEGAQESGVDVSPAERLYLKAIEAALDGDFESANELLDQAIEKLQVDR